jgi:hypothetical protein
MRCPTWVTAAEIDDWGETTAAKALLPELMCRLVYATVDRTNLKFINFPAHEEAQRPGYDGTTLIDIERTHVPKGLCYWELSCQGNPARKAQSDYETRVQAAQDEDLRQVTYFAITARDWNGAVQWAQAKTAEAKFKGGPERGQVKYPEALDIPIKHKRRLLGRTIGKLYRIEQGLLERLGLEI